MGVEVNFMQTVHIFKLVGGNLPVCGQTDADLCAHGLRGNTIPV